MATVMTISDKELKKGAKGKVVMNPNLDAILKILKSPKFKKGVDLTEGPYKKLSAGLEIDWDPTNPKSWFLSFLFVPDVNEHDHEHIDVPMDKVKELHAYLSLMIKEVNKLSKKKKTKKKSTKKVKSKR